MDWCLKLILNFSIGTMCLTLFAYWLVRMFSSPYPTLKRSKKEEEYYDPIEKVRKKFPTLDENDSIDLSVVVPAYEEQLRLPPMLDECTNFLEKKAQSDPGFTYEIIIVNDGSKDKTSDVAMEAVRRFGAEKIRLLELETNRGKGGAVTLGVGCARGSTILFADADGATTFEDMEKLQSAMKQLAEKERGKKVADCEIIACGSRAHLEQEAIASRSLFRNILMHGFHFLVWLLAVRSLRDTQCGFKLFTRRAARRCFKSLHVTRWAFDVELLYIAERLNVHLCEVAVRWTEIDGSKLVPVFSWLQMGKDLALIWLRYRLGIWKIYPET